MIPGHCHRLRASSVSSLVIQLPKWFRAKQGNADLGQLYDNRYEGEQMIGDGLPK